MLLPDEDVGNSALTGDGQKSGLEVGAVVLLVQFVCGILGAIAVEDALRVLAVRAVGLAEDNWGGNARQSNACLIGRTPIARGGGWGIAEEEKSG